ncbi:MAG: ParD-like family protein [Geobacteraceae bacterium]|nr:ParD-like family protein [Geobacteraceae bacterium]
MPQAIKINDDLVTSAKAVAAAERRSLAGQVEYWAIIGRAAEANPDLPFSLLHEMILAKAEAEAGLLEEYVFGEGEDI